MQKRPKVRVHEPVYGGGFRCGDGRIREFVLPVEEVEAGLPGEPEVYPVVLARASPVRTNPLCVHFGTCGGCQYQHAGHTAQVSLKREILGDLLARAGVPETGMVADWGGAYFYRNRIRLRVEVNAQGVQVGYSRRSTNEFLAVEMCPIAAPLLWRAAEVLTQAGEDSVWMRMVSEVELFCAPGEDRLQAMFFVRDGEAARRVEGTFQGFCERLKGVLPELAGAGAAVDPDLNRRQRKAWPGVAWGAAGLSYEVGGESYWVSRGAFFQVNRFLVETLVKLVCEGAEGKLAWDLFAGVGLFSRVLARSFARVVAVEGGEAAAGDLRQAAAGSKGRPGFEAVHAPALEFLRAQKMQRERPDLVVLDPPRAGLGVEGSALLGAIRPERVVYVSCDPETLARDLAVLTGTGYEVEKLRLLDLFPQTFHMETVVHLRRRA